VLKADAMLARFQGAGGKMRMVVYTDEKVEAEFSHPAGGTVSISWDLERAKRAGLGGKDNWKSYPRQMLRARVISEGVRTVFPGAVVGMLTPEEAVDLPAEAPEKDVTPAAVAKPASGIAALQARVAELAPKPVVDGELIEARGSGVTLESVLSAIEKSQDRDQLDVAVDLAGDLSDGNKAIARDAFVKKRAALKATSDAAA
jgi:hypothetical protein